MTMSTTIPIQDLDISISPPGNRTIHAVVTLLWPYSSSTRQCALLLSERDFRLRARGGQIRVKFSGLAARAVADGRPGIGDEVVLELGSGEWVKDEGGLPVRVPGKSVGELQFERGVRMTVKKTGGAEDVEVSVAEDAVDEVEEEEAPQVQATPRQKSNFRASFGGSPGSAAIYSSPAYMRKAAKYSYLDGISRLFEDEWDNQDLPRKKARTSLSNVKSWKMVDRTPSPERSSSGVAVQEDEEMGEADAVKDTNGNIDDPPVVESDTSPVPRVTTPPPKEQEPTTIASVEAVDPATSPRGSHAQPDVEDQGAVPATSLTSTLPRLQLPTASPSSQPSQVEIAAAPTNDPVTPRLVPLSSTALPSTTPQISPLATKNAFRGQTDDGLQQAERGTSQVVEMPESRVEVEATALRSPQPTVNDSPEQDQPAVTGDKSVAEAIAATTLAVPVTLEENEDEDAPGSSDELAEEDTFSDDEADEVLSAHEKDDEMMYEEDAEDVFDADGLEGEEPSDDETIKDPAMHQSSPDDQDMEEASAEQDSDVEEPAPDQSQIQSNITARPTASTPEREAYKQPSFTSANTLLRDADTQATNAEPAVSVEQPKLTTPFKKPTFNVGGVLPSTEVATPAARTTETPTRTPQSVRDKIPKRTFSSLFGIKGTPSPEKEDPIVFGKESNGQEKSEVEQPVNEPIASQVDIASNQKNRYMGLDGQSESEETHSLNNPPPANEATNQASSPDNRNALEGNDVPSAADREIPEQHEGAELPDASPRDQVPNESPTPALINLDSSSEEEAEAEEPKAEEITAEQAPESHETSPLVLAPTVDEHIDAELNAASVQEDLVNVVVPVLMNAEQAIIEHDILEQPTNEDHQEEEVVAAPNNDDQGDAMIQPSEAPESPQASLDAVIPDSIMEDATVSPPVALSPEPEVQDIFSVEPEQNVQASPEQSQPFDSVADLVESEHEPDQQVTSLAIPNYMQPLSPQQDEEPRPASTTPKNIPNTYGDSQPESLDVEDVDMLDAQEQEPELRRLSFESQVMQDSIDVQGQEPDASFASFESQVIQESFDVDVQQQEPEPALASFESQIPQDSLSAEQQEPDSPLASFEYQEEQARVRARALALGDPISQVQESPRQQELDSPLALTDSQAEQEMIRARELALGSAESRVQERARARREGERQQEAGSPLASFESQVVRSSRPASRDLVEGPPGRISAKEKVLRIMEAEDARRERARQQQRSSRPASRDTVEDFSPVQLGSYSQRFSEVVSGTQTLGQEDGPEVGEWHAGEWHAMDEQSEPEEYEGLAMESMTQRDMNTPSRVTKRSKIAELGSSPSSFGEFSPAKISQSVNRQALTPRATFAEEEEQEDDSMADETLIEQQLASEVVEEPIGGETRPLENQPSAEGTAQYQPLDGTSEQDEQASRRYAESTKESPAYPTLPISPSATQLTKSEARLAKAPEETSNIPQAQQSEPKRSDMPPPEQIAPPKTPGRKSLRSRLSNVPDVISAWFSPKRSSVAAQEAEKSTEVETLAAITADPVQAGSARKMFASGIATEHTYFTKLASLEKRVNEQDSAVDVLAIVADSTKEPGRAKGGPRDYYTIFKIMDPSIPTSSPIRVEVFRPWKAVLPAADVGDVILLRGFVVKSRKRQPYLLSTDSSAWCVWRFAEHTDDVGNVVVREADKSVRTRRMSHIDVREEVKGPPVEYGSAEKEEARKLRDWWIENHGDSQGGASEEAVGNTHSEEMDAIE
jgi:hypothetical protein